MKQAYLNADCIFENLIKNNLLEKINWKNNHPETIKYEVCVFILGKTQLRILVYIIEGKHLILKNALENFARIHDIDLTALFTHCAA